MRRMLSPGPLSPDLQHENACEEGGSLQAPPGNELAWTRRMKLVRVCQLNRSCNCAGCNQAPTVRARGLPPRIRTLLDVVVATAGRTSPSQNMPTPPCNAQATERPRAVMPPIPAPSPCATERPSIAVQMARARATGRAEAIVRPGSGAAPSLVARAKEVLRDQGFQPPIDVSASPATAPSR